ncbi:MAG: type II toxin-antitoxin system HicB family antitoxin [Bacteroidota bacterium]
MKSVLQYRGYTGSVEFDAESNILHGRVAGIRDIVGYHGESVEELRADFEAGVDDYLASCVEDGVAPQKPLSGKFNVRLGADRHRRVADHAKASGASLNDVVIHALDAYLEESV